MARTFLGQRRSVALLLLGAAAFLMAKVPVLSAPNSPPPSTNQGWAKFSKELSQINAEPAPTPTARAAPAPSPRSDSDRVAKPVPVGSLYDIMLKKVAPSRGGARGSKKSSFRGGSSYFEQLLEEIAGLPPLIRKLPAIRKKAPKSEDSLEFALGNPKSLQKLGIPPEKAPKKIETFRKQEVVSRAKTTGYKGQFLEFQPAYMTFDTRADNLSPVFPAMGGAAFHVGYGYQHRLWNLISVRYEAHVAFSLQKGLFDATVPLTDEDTGEKVSHHIVNHIYTPWVFGGYLGFNFGLGRATFVSTTVGPDFYLYKLRMLVDQTPINRTAPFPGLSLGLQLVRSFGGRLSLLLGVKETFLVPVTVQATFAGKSLPIHIAPRSTTLSLGILWHFRWSDL